MTVDSALSAGGQLRGGGPSNIECDSACFPTRRRDLPTWRRDTPELVEHREIPTLGRDPPIERRGVGDEGAVGRFRARCAYAMGQLRKEQLRAAKSCQPELKRIVNIAKMEQERSAPICFNMPSEDDESQKGNEERWSDFQHRVQQCAKDMVALTRTICQYHYFDLGKPMEIETPAPFNTDIERQVADAERSSATERLKENQKGRLAEETRLKEEEEVAQFPEEAHLAAEARLKEKEEARFAEEARLKEEEEEKEKQARKTSNIEKLRKELRLGERLQAAIEEAKEGRTLTAEEKKELRGVALESRTHYIEDREEAKEQIDEISRDTNPCKDELKRRCELGLDAEIRLDVLSFTAFEHVCVDIAKDEALCLKVAKVMEMIAKKPQALPPLLEELQVAHPWSRKLANRVQDLDDNLLEDTLDTPSANSSASFSQPFRVGPLCSRGMAGASQKPIRPHGVSHQGGRSSSRHQASEDEKKKTTKEKVETLRVGLEHLLATTSLNTRDWYVFGSEWQTISCTVTVCPMYVLK